MITLEAEGLVLKQFTPEDAQVIFDLIDRNREHLSQNGDQTSEKYPTLESVLESITHPSNPNRLRFGIWENGTYVGTINLTIQETQEGKEAEIGYYLGKEFEGRGYMTKAAKRIVQYSLDELQLNEVHAWLNRNNSRSAETIKRAGLILQDPFADPHCYVKTK